MKYDLEKALDLAIDSCISDHILEDFLRKNRDEVKNVLMLDYTFERQLQLEKEEAQEIIEAMKSENVELAEKYERAESENVELAEKYERSEKEKIELENKNKQAEAEICRMKKLLYENGIEF